jgi:radical SAM superfamily enzyme YgiQ (UPF0313 family)
MPFRLTLMHPPLDDPTLPYHSNAYLAGHLRHSGFDGVSLRDVNIEYIAYCLEPATIQYFHDEVDRRLDKLRQLRHLSYREQEQYFRLSASPRFTHAELSADVSLLQTRSEFLNYPRYVRAMRRLNGHFCLVGSLSYPGEIDNFMLKSRGRYSPYSLSDLLSADLAEKLCYSFACFFEERMRSETVYASTDVFGISVVYDHQLIHAIHLARMLKRTWPEKRVIFGGTAISQLYKYLKDRERIKAFFKLCDGIVIGEGETAICEIADCRGDLSGGRKITNTLTYDPYRDSLTVPTLHYEDLSKLGPPHFDHAWDLYLSPERGINYSPTRGCYWNRCTFCDYGLNSDRPTSPWRERPIEQVIADLEQARRHQGVRYVYLAVDVLAPAYLERLSEAMLASGLDLHWSAEIRLEKVFSADRCRKIARSGAVSISVGMESGNQRILDLIDKGTRVDFMGQTIRNFAEAGVAVQLMAFCDFPTETPEEALQTRRFLKDHAEYWSTGGVAQFLLTGTSMIARQPEKFGIAILDTKGADIARAITYTTGGGRKGNFAEEADASFDSSGCEFPSILGRPWAGGTDTLHSMIYYEAYGRKCFKTHTLDALESQQPALDDLLDCTISLEGRLAASNLDLTQIFANRQLLVDYLKECLDRPAEPTYSSFLEWERGVPPVSAGTTGETYWLVSLVAAAKLSRLVYQLLQVASSRRITVRALMAGFAPDVRQKLLEYLQDVGKQNLLSFTPPEKLVELTPSGSCHATGVGNIAARVAPPVGSDQDTLAQLARATSGRARGL